MRRKRHHETFGGATLGRRSSSGDRLKVFRAECNLGKRAAVVLRQNERDPSIRRKGTSAFRWFQQPGARGEAGPMRKRSKRITRAFIYHTENRSDTFHSEKDTLTTISWKIKHLRIKPMFRTNAWFLTAGRWRRKKFVLNQKESVTSR